MGIGIVVFDDSQPLPHTKAGGTESKRIGFENTKFVHGGTSHIHAGQNKATHGIARCTDVIVCGTGKIEKGIEHEAMFPKEIPDYCIKLACPHDGIVLDNFIGSGTTAVACIENNVNFFGIEKKTEFVHIARSRVSKGGQSVMNF